MQLLVRIGVDHHYAIQFIVIQPGLSGPVNFRSFARIVIVIRGDTLKTCQSRDLTCHCWQIGMCRSNTTRINNITSTRISDGKDHSRKVASPNQADRVRLKINTLQEKVPIKSRTTQLSTARVAADLSRKSRIFCQARRGNPVQAFSLVRTCPGFGTDAPARFPRKARITLVGC